MLLIAAPGVTSSVAVLTAASEPILGLAIVLNVATGVAISSALFLAVSVAAARLADERVDLVRETEAEQWRARVEKLSISCRDGLFAVEWYFRLRLDEEIRRAERYRLTFAVLLVQPPRRRRKLDVRATTDWFSEHVVGQLRGSDLPAILNDGSVAVLLPNTGREASVSLRIQRGLANSDCRIGLATFPEDGAEVEDLLAAAARDWQRAAPDAKARPDAVVRAA